MENFLDDVMSNNKTDPLYKSRKKSYYRSKSVEGDKDQVGEDQLKLLTTKQESDMRKKSSRNNEKKGKPRT